MKKETARQEIECQRNKDKTEKRYRKPEKERKGKIIIIIINNK